MNEASRSAQASRKENNNILRGYRVLTQDTIYLFLRKGFFDTILFV